jgi:c-di-GMP-binding flagellar brake protein YcgR
MTEDRRRFARLSCAVEVEYMVVKNRQTVPLNTDTRNVSLGGMSFMSFDRLIPGDVLKMKLILPGVEQALAIRARVIWCAPTRMGGTEQPEIFDTGIEFTDLSPEAKDILNRFITNASVAA